MIVSIKVLNSMIEFPVYIADECIIPHDCVVGLVGVFVDGFWVSIQTAHGPGRLESSLCRNECHGGTAADTLA